MRSTNRLLNRALFLTFACALHANSNAADLLVSTNSLADLTLEQLSNIEVTSVSGRAESLRDAPASIYVITGDEIRRSAARSLPEALRLAPNLQVASLNAGQYAISARGFNNAIGNKLLVLIDGRTVYSPLFSGVFWDMNDVMLEDVDRIEVVSGPGGTLWGANAVNGVINVITRAASDTQGTLVTAMRSGASGGYEAARQGGQFASGGSWRVYALAMDRTRTSREDMVRRADAVSKRQVGFRADSAPGSDRFTVQGDAYEGGQLPANNLAPLMTGGNLMLRWDRLTEGGSRLKLQGYLDYAMRDDVNAFRDRSSTADLQFTHEPVLPEGHQLLWGGGLRETQGSNATSPAVMFSPQQKRLRWANVFVQHEWQFAPQWQAVAGAKLESNVYTGVEFMPNLRLTHKDPAGAMTWAAVSRAVRAPSRLDREFFSPGRQPYVIAGGPDFNSEIATVYELGHRGFAARGISYSATLFRQRYDGLRAGTPTVPTQITNAIAGHVDGLEAWGTWQAAESWRLSAGLLALREDLRIARPVPDASAVATLGNDPRAQWSLRSSHTLGSKGELDLIVRHVGRLPSPMVRAYTAADLRFGWKVSPMLELSVIGRNLFDPGHIEFNAPGVASVIERQLYIKATWQM